MNKYLGWALWGVLGIAVATGMKTVSNWRYDSEDDPRDVHSRSQSHARRDGILAARLDAEIADKRAGSGGVSIAEAWIEKCAVHRYSFVWLRHRVSVGGFTVVIKLSEPTHPSFALWPPERKSSFSWVGGKYYVRYFEEMPTFPMVVFGSAAKDAPAILILSSSTEPKRPVGHKD